MKHALLIIVGVLIVTNFGITILHAAPGDLDSTFDGDGKVTTCCGNSPGHSVAIQSDGKIVVAGITRNLITYRFQIWLVRYNTNGSIDTSFGNNGEVRTDTVSDIDNGINYRTPVGIQADGKIVVAHWADDTGGNGRGYGTFIYRYDANGALDPTFDNDGIANVRGVNYTDVYMAQSLRIQPDGKILVAVRYHEDVLNSPIEKAFGVLRFNSSGTLDSTFGNNGFAFTTSLLGNPRSEDVPYAVDVQSDGKIILAGSARRSNGGDMFGIVRYDAGGTLDTSFDGDGIVTTQIANDDVATSVGIQPDGKIVVAGLYAVARYNSNGSLDTSFDGDGKVVITGGVTTADRLIIQPNGKIVIAATDYFGDFMVARYNPNGSPDGTWGTGGVVTTDFGRPDDDANSIAIQTDGKIVVAGNSDTNIAMARYLGDLAPTSASVSVSGRVSDANGRGISKARVTIQNAATGASQTVLTNPFGFYSFAEVQVGETYILSAEHKRYQFSPRVITVLDEIADADLHANP